MKRTNVTSDSPYEDTIGFSRGVRLGSNLYISGTAPIAPDGSTAAPGDALGQARRCLEIMAGAVKDGGARMEDIVRTRIYITDASYLDDVGRAHAEYFRDIRPASTVVVVKGFAREDWLVEFEADCIVGDS